MRDVIILMELTDWKLKLKLKFYAVSGFWMEKVKQEFIRRKRIPPTLRTAKNVHIEINSKIVCW